jgi:hypothetical protein
VALGSELGCSLVTIHGHNGDVDTGTIPEDIWEGGGLYPFLAAASALEIVSDDADDDDGDTGARTVRVESLDANYESVTQIVTMNGTTPVALTGTHLRVNKVQVITSGSSGSNEGVLTLRVPGPGSIVAVVDNNGGAFGDGIAHNGIYTVPAGYKLQYIYNQVSMLRNVATTAHVMLRVRPFGESWRTVNQFSPNAQGSGVVYSESPATPILGPKTDIRYTVVDVGANNVVVSCFGVVVLMPTGYQV